MRQRDLSNPCTAHKKSGAACKQPAIPGGTVCRYHGGSAPQVIAKARARIIEAADKVAARLIKIATDKDSSEAAAVQAARDLLDRAGLKVPEQHELSGPGGGPLVIGVSPLEQLSSRIAGIAERKRTG